MEAGEEVREVEQRGGAERVEDGVGVGERGDQVS